MFSSARLGSLLRAMGSSRAGASFEEEVVEEKRFKSLYSASVVVNKLSGVVELRYLNEPVLAFKEAQTVECQKKIWKKHMVYFQKT